MLVTQNVTDALDHAPIASTVLPDSTNVVLFVSKHALPTNSLITMLVFVLPATLSAKLAAVFNSVPLAPILKLFQSMVSVTTAHILAIPATQVPPSVLPASLDSTLSVLPVSLPAPLEPTQATESVSATQV